MQEIRLTDPRAIKTIEAFAAREGIFDRGQAAAVFINLAHRMAHSLASEAKPLRISGDPSDVTRPAPIEADTLASWLRMARLRCGWEQTLLAERSGVSRELINRIECGRITAIGPLTMQRIVMALGHVPPRNVLATAISEGCRESAIETDWHAVLTEIFKVHGRKSA